MHLTRLAWLIAMAGAALSCSLDATDTPSSRSEIRRVVLIVIDTLRADHLAVYGYEKDTAPFLSRLAERGTVFERAHSSSSWTAPSTSSIMTGLYPTRHGVTEGFFAHQNLEALQIREGRTIHPLAKLPSDVPVLAERLRAAGFRTFGVASNINIGPAIGFDRGFERLVHDHNAPADTILAEVPRWAPATAASSERSFLYLHLNDVHSPYKPRAPWFGSSAPDKESDVAAYDSEISYVDFHLERLADQLGWDEDTLVVVVSDHGEEFGDHGGWRHDGGLHAELTRVVMIISGPGVERGRVSVDVSLIDLLPTLLELVGLEPGRLGVELDGRSLVPLLRPSNDAAPDESFTDRALLMHRAKMGRNYGRHWWAIVHDGWKLIVDDGELALYDHRSDRKEMFDRSKYEPERIRALMERLDALRAAGPSAEVERTDIVLDEEMVETLEALGYTDRSDAEMIEADVLEETPRER